MKYLYCIINKEVKKNFGKIGIANKRVYAIPYRKFSIVSHNLKGIEELENKEKTDLMIEHLYVINVIMKKYNAIIPFYANTLVETKKLKEWIDKNYKQLKEISKEVRSKQEFGIDIFYSPEKKAELEGSVEDYIEEIKTKIAKYKKDFYNMIEESVDDIKINKTLENELITLSCLVHKNKIEQLKTVLKKINNFKEVKVEVTGPWPPYNFI